MKFKLFGKRDADEDDISEFEEFDDVGSSLPFWRKRGTILIVSLAAVAAIGGVSGYYLVSGDSSPETAAEGPPPEAPVEGTAETGGSVIGGSLDIGAIPPPVPGVPPADGGNQGGESLLNPTQPFQDSTAETDLSTGRRPWLTATPELTGEVPPLPETPPPSAEVPQVPGEPGVPEVPPVSDQAPPPEQAAAAPPPTEGPQQPPVEPPTAEPPPTETQPPSAEPPAAASPPAVPAARPAPLALISEPPYPAPPERNENGIILPRWADVPAPTRAGPALDVAPDSDLLDGNLPIIAEDGRRPWQFYARPFEDTGKPRVAIVITGLGLQEEATKTAIKRTPPEVTLAFDPYTANLSQWINEARAAGHEVLLSIPMESKDFPSKDTGPLGLLTLLGPSDNLTRLQRVLGSAGGYIGIVGSDGENFLATAQHLKPILKELTTRGLLYLDNGAGMKAAALAPNGLALASAETWLDAKGFKGSVDARLVYTQAAAERRGSAVALATATPLTLARIGVWAASLNAPQAKVSLAPLSAVIKQ